MARHVIIFVFLSCFIWIGVVFVGCSADNDRHNDDYFIKVGNRTITVGDFNKAFEFAKIAYTHKQIQQPDVMRKARLRLIRQMTEEMILLQRAEDLGVSVKDSEIERALEELKRDYPDNAFQETLLEYAVPYTSWRKELKTRLLMEKVIAIELGNKIQITQDDISKYYEEHFEDDITSSDVKGVPEDVSAVIEKILRKAELEKSYAAWIEKLKKNYAVQINKKELEKTVGS